MWARTIPATACVAILALFVSMGAVPAFAKQARGVAIQEAPGTPLDGRIVISPGAEVVPGQPGKRVVRKVLLQNRQKAEVTFDLVTAEVVGSSSEQIVDIRYERPRGGAAGWTKLAVAEVTVPPGATATIDVTIAVPKSAPPGSKALAVAATQRTTFDATGGGAGVTPVFRAVAIFIVDLPGDAAIDEDIATVDLRPKARFDGRLRTEGKPPTVAVAYRNEGARLLKPAGVVRVKNLFGGAVKEYAVGDVTVYPEGENRIEVELGKLPRIGLFSVDMQLTSEGRTRTYDLGRFLRAPAWLLVATIALLLAGIALAGWWLWNRRTRNSDEWDSGSDEDDDDLDDHPR